MRRWGILTKQDRENSLNLHGRGCILGISPLRAGGLRQRRHLSGAPVEMTGVEGFEQKEIFEHDEQGPAFWGELPEMAWQRTRPRGLSTPRQRFLW